jgi:hypothetical protein
MYRYFNNDVTIMGSVIERDELYYFIKEDKMEDKYHHSWFIIK